MADNPINKNNVNDAKEYLKVLLDITDVSRDITDYFKTILKNSDLNKVSQAEILSINKQISKTLFDQADNIEKVLENRKSTKDIARDILKNEELIKKAEKESGILVKKKGELQLQQQKAFSQGNVTLFDQLTDQIMMYDKINNKLEEQQKLIRENIVANEAARDVSKEADKFSKSGGFKFLEGFVKSIPGLKAFGGAFEKATEASRGAALGGGNSLTAGFKELLGPLTKMSFIFGGIAVVIKFFIDAMFEADKRVTDIAKNFSISKDNARAQYEVLKSSKTVLTSILDSTKNITEAFSELASLSDFTYQSSFKQLDIQIQLTKEIGIQAEEALQLQQLFMLNNNEADKGLSIIYDQIAAFANQNKIVADGRKIISDINKLSGLIKLNFRGNTGELVKTVLEAKKLGLTLDQITKTQSSLLDFESSISAQIEAELLTGKQINLERARLFALNNDIAGLTKEIAKQNITSASFSRMNAIQQESIAKTLGMSASELGDTLYKQELINKAGGKELKNKRDYIALLKQEGKLTEAARLEQELTSLEAGLIRGEALQDAQKSLDAQTKFTEALERAKETFSDLVTTGAIDKLSDFVIKFANALSSGQSLASLLLFGPRNENKEEKQNRQMSSLGVSQSEIKQIQKGEIVTAGTGPKFAEGGIVKKPIYNATVGEAGPEAIIPLNSSEGLGGLIKAQQETNMLLKQLLAKDTNLYVDYTKFATAGSKVSYNI